jgi:hypothetical protein
MKGTGRSEFCSPRASFFLQLREEHKIGLYLYLKKFYYLILVVFSVKIIS